MSAALMVEPAAHVPVQFTVAGAWLPGVLLPPELADALAREVVACLPASPVAA